MKLDPFYPIFDSAEWLSRLVPLGIKLVQLRIKDKNDAVLRDHIREGKKICAHYDCTLIINDHWQIAIEEQCDFIHLGQEDLVDADLAAIRKARLRLGISTHDGAELDIALSEKPAYVALGPVYETILKKMKWAPQGLEKVSRWKEKVGALPLVAIGGLNVERGVQALKAGADCASAVTDITLNENPELRVKQWLEATAAWR